MAKIKTGKQKVFEELARMKDLKVSDLDSMEAIDERMRQSRAFVDMLKREERKNAT